MTTSSQPYQGAPHGGAVADALRDLAESTFPDKAEVVFGALMSGFTLGIAAKTRAPAWADRAYDDIITDQAVVLTEGGAPHTAEGQRVADAAAVDAMIEVTRRYMEMDALDEFWALTDEATDGTEGSA